MRLFDKNTTMPLVLGVDAPEAVRLAVEDLQRNLRQLSGQARGFPTRHRGEGICVCTDSGKAAESYTVQVTESGVEITGGDTLGTVYGIYAFATRCLKIIPMYRLVDVFPSQRESLDLEEQSFSSQPCKVRWRGWFLNDEDLLCDFKLSGGHRNIDYPFYQNVMDTDVLDMVLEAALRLEINLVIPGSFVDICNPDEEKLVKAVCRRGLYISQHHIEPVGVSFDTANNYLKARGLNETVSFVRNRTRMEEIWHHYITKWAVYGDHVVWQLGLRGKGDQAVWQADPTVPRSMADRGAIITDAIATQYAMIRQTLGREDFPSTATLWNEGSQLYGDGYLRLPESTISIFSDFGLSQMFGEDFYSMPRQRDKKYGIYYHVGFWSMGPHLAEGCNPEKMAYCYRDAARLNSLEYSILNVSNVRPLHMSVTLNAWLLSAPDTVDISRAMAAFDTAIFEENAGAVSALRRAYYSAFADLGRDALLDAAQKRSFYYRPHKDISFIENAATDGQLAWIGRCILRGRFCSGFPALTPALEQALHQSAEKFSLLWEQTKTVRDGLPAEKQNYFRCFIEYPVVYMYRMTRFAEAAISLADPTAPKEEKQKQCLTMLEQLGKLLEERKVLEQGVWENWHRGEKKINIPELRDMTKVFYERITTDAD